MKKFIQKLKKILALTSIITMTMIGSRSVLASENMRIVPANKVCMVTNMVFPRTQIPVWHERKTYYGCCENCKKTLSEDSNARDDSSVVYFESNKTFKKYAQGLKK